MKNSANEQQYYDWQRTFSYNAPLTIVVGARGIGKTYGLRKACLKDFLKDGSRYVEVFRTKAAARVAAPGYFDKIALDDDFTDWEFKSDATGGYMKPRGSGKKVKFQRVCYFVPMTAAQQKKQATFARVKRIFFDEFILDRSVPFARYMPGEFSRFGNIIDTVTRQRAGDGTAPRAYLLGNAVDLINPYFTALGISEPPKPGYTWHAGKRVLVHSAVQSESDAAAKLDSTLAGMILDIAGDEAEIASATQNVFTPKGDTFVDRKAKVAYPLVSLVWRGIGVTLWARIGEGPYYHIRKGISEELKKQGRVYYFSKDDARIDYRAARRAEKSLRWIADALAHGKITTETPAEFETLTEVVNYLGLSI